MNTLILMVTLLTVALSISYLILEGKSLILPIISKKHRWFAGYQSDPRLTGLWRVTVASFILTIALILLDWSFLMNIL